jgi:hypothetical protein
LSIPCTATSEEQRPPRTNTVSDDDARVRQLGEHLIDGLLGDAVESARGLVEEHEDAHMP